MSLGNCQIFTPTETVKYMLDLIDYNENIFGKTIIDNSCGCGNFLIEIAERFIIDGQKKRKKKTQIKQALEECLYGYDVDENCVKKTLFNLNELAKKYKYKDVRWNISTSDGLYIDLNGTFDFVVGNPPYVAYVDLDDRTRQSTKEHFISCETGKFDYSYAFIEKGLNLLKGDGKMVMITPSNMFKTVFGENLRTLIRPYITNIIDCSARKIFDKVLTSPAITLYKKDNTSTILIYSELDADNNVNVERIIEKNTLVDKWNFTDYAELGERRFGDLYKVSNSVATLANKIFVHNKDNNGIVDIDIEDDIFRIAKSPKSEKYGKDQVIIFPYFYEKNKLKEYSLEEMNSKFPKAMKYLNTKKEELLCRDSDTSAEWFQFGRSQALRHINREKLLLSSIVTNSINIYKLSADTVPYSGLYIISLKGESLDKAKLILETERFYNYLLTKGIKVHGKSIRISSKDIEEYKY